MGLYHRDQPIMKKTPKILGMRHMEKFNLHTFKRGELRIFEELPQKAGTSLAVVIAALGSA